MKICYYYKSDTRNSNSNKRCIIGTSDKRQSAVSLILVSVLLFVGSREISCLSEGAAKRAPSQEQPQNGTKQQEFKLDCKVGEQRHFNYESATKVWGSSSQQVYLRATLRLSCMEPASNSTLKYLAEILSVTGDFGDVVTYNTNPISSKYNSERRSNDLLRVEPVLEEVGEAISEAADRVKRSVSGWFTKTWGSVKDFFVNIFASSEKSTVSREDAFRESGIDISSQCRGKGKPAKGLPIDDSVFDDLEPKYYIGASTVGAGSNGDSFRVGASYDFDDDDQAATLDSPGGGGDATISFFDDPKPLPPAPKRPKRALASDRALGSQLELDHERLLRLPFVFVQSRSGRVIEVRFSSEESDFSVKNFKRHLCDLFATNLDSNRSQTNELSPIGQHATKYIVDPTLNSSLIKQSLLKSAEQTKFLVKALGVAQQLQPLVGMTPPGKGSHDSSGWSGDENSVGGEPVDSRDPSGGDEGASLSVLRSINSTSSLQLNSRAVAPDIDQIHVRVKQLQQINEGRMVGSAGQLAMSLAQSGSGLRAAAADEGGPQVRLGRSTTASHETAPGEQQLSDIADLLKVSTSFTVRLVPLSKLGDFGDPAAGRPNGPKATPAPASRAKRAFGSASSPSDNKSPKAGDLLSSGANDEQVASKSPGANNNGNNDKDSDNRAPPSSGGNNGANNSLAPGQPKAKGASNREPLVIRPEDQQQLQRTLMEWRQLELRLQLVPSNLLPESSGQDGQLQRLEILRNQIRMRLNEEFMRNRGRSGAGDWPGSSSGDNGSELGKQVAAIVVGTGKAQQPAAAAEGVASNKLQAAGQQRNDLGLGLTQLILDSGITAKRKGSVYGTIEEVLELEMSLGEEGREGSVSRLMRDTIRIGALRSHCKSAIATLDEIRAQPQKHGAGVESKSPFGLLEDDYPGDTETGPSLSNERLARLIAGFQSKNRRKLDQCKQVVQLLLRVGDKQTAELVLELMDECNNRMLSGAKYEELGHGPTSRYYRSLRQQFTELMANINRPSEQLLDKLLGRLHYSKLGDNSETTKRHRNASIVADPRQEFVYVSPTTTTTKQQRPSDGSAAYNKSLLREEDNYNNDEGAGSLVMTITTLAAKQSIGHRKRVEVAEKLLQILKGSSCSLLSGPDLDILESMGNFQEPLEEIVGKVIHLARRCRHQDQYVVACVHGLQGQLRHPATVRFLADQLRAHNGSCTVKSEIVLTLIGAILVDELRQSSQPKPGVTANQIPSSEPAPNQWPSVGLNQVDEILLELVGDARPASQNANSRTSAALKKTAQNAQDRRCLKQLVGYYMSKKRQTNMDNDISRPVVQPTASDKSQRGSRGAGSRSKRAVINDDSFWDEAQCKRWAMPDPNALASDGDSIFNTTDLVDEIDDNSILLALAQNKPTNGNSGAGRSARRNQKLIEREADLPTGSSSPNGSSGGGGNLPLNGSVAIIRRRHKCTATKHFGPKNAEAALKVEIVNDLVGGRDENKFLARFRLATNFLGNRIDVGRMYLWHQRHTTRAHVNILGKSLWDTSHGCEDKAPRHLLYMPLFDFNLWLVKVSVGLRLHSEMGFFSNCDPKSAPTPLAAGAKSRRSLNDDRQRQSGANTQLELFPTMSVRASGEASAKFVVARAGMSLASQYGYQGNIRVSQQPESCMSISSAHQPMNITFSSWFQLWDSDCHYWGSRNKAEPQATKWKLSAHKPSVWLEDECLIEPMLPSPSSANSSSGSPLPASTLTRSLQTISP